MKKLLLLGLLALPAFAQTFVQAPSSLIVPAGSSIQGVAGTAAAIDYTIDCVEQYTTTPQIPKQCAQGQLSNSVGSIYAPTSLYNGFVTHITLTNDTGSTVPGITLYKGGTAAANTIYGTISIAAHNRCSWTSGADWTCTDATGALLTSGSSSGGGGSVIGGTGINITGGTTVNISNQIAAGGPTGSATVAPILTYNAQGQLTAVGSATIAPPFSAITGTASCAQLPPLTGAVTSSGCSTTAVAIPTTALTGTLQAAQEPAHTGGVTNTAGSLALTVQTNANLTGPVTSSGNATTITPTITGAGPIGSSTVAPVITYNAAGQLTTVTTATITPPFSALTGSASCAQLPALIGDTTTTAGTCATSTTKTGGVAFGTLATLSAAPAGTLTGAALAAGVTGSSLTSVGTLGALTVTAPIAGSVTGSAASLSAVLDCTKFPALSGGITTSAGSCVTTVVSAPTTALTGVLQAAQEPAHLGDCTNTAGSLTLGCTKFNSGTSFGGAAGDSPGTSVIAVGTALEAAHPVTVAAITGASKAWALSDFGTYRIRSNSGSAMTDTFPAASTISNGRFITVSNTDATATLTLTATGTTFGTAGATSFVIQPARRTTFLSDGTSTYQPWTNNNNLVKTTGATTAGHLATFVDTTGINIQDGGAIPAGTVTSVAQTVPAGFAVSGSPVTSTGTLAISYATGQAQNLFLATPNGSTGALSERAIVAADVPTLNQNTSGSAGSLSATLGCAQFPALSGAITTSAGSCVTTAAAIPTTALTGALQAGQFPALTGDCTTTAGALATSCTKTGGVAFGTLATLNAAPAGTLTGTTLNSTVTASSLTSVGTLSGLTVTAPITGSVTGNAATVTTNANLTGPVTSTGNATAVTPGALTNTMLATMNANTVKANITAGVASPTDVTLSSFKTWLALVSTDISDFATAVRATVLTGLSTATNAVVSATDTVLQAIGKLQAQITANKLMYNAVGDFGMVGDQRVTFDGACSTGSNTKVTSATAAFVSGDNGHRITLAGGGASGATLVATISNIDSGTQVTVTGATCGTTVSAKGLQLGTDNTTACNLIVSTMNALTYPGAKIMFPPSSTNRWACPVSLPFTVGVDLVGQASAITQDFADYTKSGGTALVWWGTDNDAGVAFQGFVQFSAVVANNRPLSGAGLHDIWLDCRNGDQNPCATAARFVDVVGMDVRNVFVMDALSGFNTATADMGSVTSSSGRGTFSNIGARLLDNTNTPQAGVATAVTLTPTFVTAGSNAQVMTAAGSQSIAISAANGFATPGYFWFTAANGSVYFLKCTGGGSTTTLTGCAVSTDGASENPTLVGAASAATASSIVQASPNNGAAFFTEGTANTNSNLFTIDEARWSFGTNYGPAAIEMHNSDSNVVRQSVGNGGNVTNDGAVDRVRRPGVRFGGSSASATQASRNNSFYDGDPGVGGVVAMGVNNAGAILAGASGPNYWYRYQTGNGAAIPVVEAVTATATQAPVGAIFEWTGNGPLTQGQGPNHPSTLTPGNSLVSTAATDVVIPGCLVKNPPQWAQAGLSLQWRITMSKTAAGTPTHIYKIFYGASGAVGTDAAVLTSATGVAGTAAADAQEITLTMALPSVGASVTPLGSVMRTGKMNVVATGYGNLTATAPTMAAINTGTAQTFLYPAIRTSATGETNTVLSCRADVIQAAAQ